MEGVAQTLFLQSRGSEETAKTFGPALCWNRRCVPRLFALCLSVCPPVRPSVCLSLGGWGGEANYNHHLGLSDSDRPRLVVMIWAGALFIRAPPRRCDNPDPNKLPPLQGRPGKDMCSRICISRRNRAEPSGLLPRFWARLGRPLQRPSASMCVLMWSKMSRRRAPNSSTVSVQGCLLRHRLPAPDPSSPAEFGRLEQKISLERTNINEYIG